MVEKPCDRLRKAREAAGFASAAAAARAFGWTVSTYQSHENGNRDLRPAIAERYAKAFRVSPEFLLYERDSRARAHEKTKTIPLVGYVGAGGQAYFTPAGELGEVEIPIAIGAETVAVEIRGDSLGPFFNRWLAYYDDIRRPVTPDLIGRLCVVGLADGRVLIKRLQQSKTKGLFHLLSQYDDPITDVAVEWAARVRSMVQR